MNKFSAAALTALVLSVGTGAHAASITNGSFEEDSGIGVGSFRTLGNGDMSITGWTVGGSAVDWIGSYWS